MLIRAVIVALLVLNIGVAAWWLASPRQTGRPERASAPVDAPGIPRLLLADEQPADPSAGNERPAFAPASAPPAVDYCVSYGPFATADDAAQAQQRLRAAGVRVGTRAQAGPPYRGWKVWLPPMESPGQVQEVAARVAAAGFKDQFIVRDGRDAGSLALGRFTAEAPARQRAEELVAAGFPARAEPIGTGTASYWLDVTASASDAQRLRPLVAAAEAHEMDCDTWRPIR